MSKSGPIYQDRDATYTADTCAPLVRATEAGELHSEALVNGHYCGRKIPRGALTGIKTVGFWDAQHDQNWGLDWHRNEGIELTLLESGRVGFSVEGDDHQLRPGDLTVTRPWQSHRVGCPNVGAGRLHWLIIDVGVRQPHQAWRWPSWIVLAPSDRDELTDILRHNERPVWPSGEEILICFRKISAAVEADRDGSSTSRLTVLINELLLLTLEMLRRADVSLDRELSATRRSVELLLADLQDNPRQLAEDVSVRDLAQLCGLGVTQFNAHCKRLTNMTPNQYIKHLRLGAAAAMLLEQPTLSITDVAIRCGFSSSQYFATTFQNRFGCSPRVYRDSHRSK
ncbi:HTH-type transcriptional activator RhaS [Planctomycetes bacterium CA13]|uniref:HTH-type transcriptional activator RhaS n=1 Tax=Novipirellula herctigrandis TaxID=2527986 RepID=A0A5C5Z9Y4_9BACT|nr:HTH-type transcriptional activator RhaS [Planctomycetes bacterium CA13]